MRRTLRIAWKTECLKRSKNDHLDHKPNMPKFYSDQIYAPGHPDGEWIRLRMGKVTASDVKRLLTNKGALRDSEGVETYVYEALAEVWRGVPNPSFGSKAIDNGKLWEDRARAAVMLECEIEPEQMPNCFFVETDDGLAGCSPDGIINTDWQGLGFGGMELKCPGPVKQVEYLLECGPDEIPEAYFLQCQHSMYVSGRQWRLFASVSFGADAEGARDLPMFLRFVRRDEKICAAIGKAVAAFHEKFTAGMEKLKKYESQ